MEEAKEMNELESFLHENPQLIEKFLEDNGDLLKTIKSKYAEMLEIGRFLLSTALMEIVKTTTQAGQELLKAEIAERAGLYIMDIATNNKGNC